MERRSGVPTIAAALILGASVVGAAVLIEQALERTGEEIASLTREVSRLSSARPSAPSAPTARRGPDPQQRHRLRVDGAPAKGPADAKVVLVEFSDFQCPFCRRVNPTLARVREEYGDDVRIVFKHLPLGIHPKAPAAHAAAEAAHRQEKFWEMHDLIFSDPANLTPERFRDYAGRIGLDLARYDRDLADPAVQARVDADLKEAEELGVSGTPSFFVNGRYLSGALPFQSFKTLIDQELRG